MLLFLAIGQVLNILWHFEILTWELHVANGKIVKCVIQSFLYFKTIHGTMKMWSYTAGGLKINVKLYTKLNLRTKIGGLIINVVLR